MSTPSGNTVIFAILTLSVPTLLITAVVFPSFTPVTSPVLEIDAILLFPVE